MSAADARPTMGTRPGASGGLRLAPLFGAGALALLLGGAVARAYPSLLSSLWTCTFKALTGLPCPTCGISRVLVLLAHGEVGAAFALSPLPAVAVVLSLLAGAWHLLAWGFRLPLPDDVIGRWRSRAAVRWSAVASGLVLWGYAIVRSLLTGAP